MFWLIKSEPSDYSWAQMKKDNTTIWSGVKNWQALANMRKMKTGEECFFYHTGNQKAIVGIVTVIEEFKAYDDNQPKIGAVVVKYNRNINPPITLTQMKQNPLLAHLFKQSRLSVIPIDNIERKIISEINM